MRRAASCLARSPAIALRHCSSKAPPVPPAAAKALPRSKRRETLAEKNTRLRLASEANLEKSREVLAKDFQSRADTGSLREVLHNRVVTVDPPPTALCAPTAAFAFPNLSATSLAGQEEQFGTAAGSLFNGRWTLVGMLGSNFAQEMVDGWILGVAGTSGEAAPASGGAPAPLQTRWLSIVEGAVLGWLRWPLLASMKRGVPAERHARFLCLFDDDASGLRDALRMSNRYLGYVCLVDPHGRVRWHTHGNEVPTEDAVAALKALVAGAIAGDASVVAGGAAPKPKRALPRSGKKQ